MANILFGSAREEEDKRLINDVLLEYRRIRRSFKYDLQPEDAEVLRGCGVPPRKLVAYSLLPGAAVWWGTGRLTQKFTK
jgi:hypothetical protein